MNMISKTPANLGWAPTSPAEIWEKQLEALPNVRRVEDGDFKRLHDMLLGLDDPDSYLTSPNYYLFSGRHGLWAVEEAGAVVLLCWHPNIQGKIVAFPQLRGTGQEVLKSVLALLPMPPKGLMIARVKEDAPLRPATGFTSEGKTLFHKRHEELLDWTYPVHLLSTNTVAACAGPEFMYVRNRLRQLQKLSVTYQPFDAVHHSRAMENLLHRWVSVRAADQAEYENLYSPYDALFSMSMNPQSGLSGMMVFVEGQLEAVGLWDISGTKQKSGNLFVNLCSTAIKGLSEFLIVKSCEALRDQNIEFLNVGGSETEGLDTFKRKFRPGVSIPMCSIDVELANGRSEDYFWSTAETSFHV